MGTIPSDIKRWFESAPEETHHMVVVCDTYDHEDYPVYVKGAAKVEDAVKHHDGKNMQKVMEVYSLTGKHTLEDQLKEYRANHLD